MTTIAESSKISPARWVQNVDVTTIGPDISSLIERLHFDLPEGMIWLDESRVTLMHVEWLVQLRSELVALLGYHQTRALFTRLGYNAGCRDARASIARNPSQSWEEMVLTGGQMHMLHGSVSASVGNIDVDETKRHCEFEFIWKNSIERIAEEERRYHSSETGCWMEIGYASGFLTTCFGAPVLARELFCCSGGHDHCRGIARFVDQWGDDKEDLIYFTALQVNADGTLVQPVTATMAVEKSDDRHVLGDGTTMIGRSTAFNDVLHKVNQVADTRATVLLLGESGVGKSVFAAQIHDRSLRSDKPFVEINCAAIPESLIEAELFGVEKGAFTGAAVSRAGRFEEALGGSIFLDEVATLSLSAQGKLLRILQNQKFERLGSNKTLQADVRVIAATNEDLEVAVREGRFRSDLFYRLNVFPIHVPSLRNRKDDLPVLVDHFIRLFSERHGREVGGISTRAYRLLLAHKWPGNIRELENMIERAVILCHKGETLDVAHFPGQELAEATKGLLRLDHGGHLAQLNQGSPDLPADMLEVIGAGKAISLADLERAAIEAALEATGHNVAQAAKRLGVTRAQIDYRLKKWQS
ncbi:AAA domain-containing protein [Sphingomonas histidinilytica]|uniref:sigma-54-dependent Fis family transcriptional regulator n=1 Tax=Rhizorhabdus histidinilytica TaxID=439228 RepID=UPI001ADA2386|nr:sigma-54-dependent Fis family transcriptional regulator [Rhizorhabdus histidinilytica]MBO9380761.1 AAA domain-containing protein [Rhizorhabdus histidinilytica]